MEQYKKMYSRINQMYTSSDKNRASDLIGLIMNVQNYVFRNQDCVRKELKSMGGKVLQLESEKNIEKGRKEGFETGQMTGQMMLGTLINRLIMSGRSAEVGKVATDSNFRNNSIKNTTLNQKISPNREVVKTTSFFHHFNLSAASFVAADLTHSSSDRVTCMASLLPRNLSAAKHNPLLYLSRYRESI